MSNCCNPCHCCDRKLSSTSVTVVGDTVEIAVLLEAPLKPQTKYCLILAQPCPVAGFNLPVNIVVTFTDGTIPPAIVPLKRAFDPCHCGICDLEFGEDLPKCRNRIPLYYTNGNDFIDLRKCEHLHFCKCKH